MIKNLYGCKILISINIQQSLSIKTIALFSRSTCMFNFFIFTKHQRVSLNVRWTENSN